jgi:hypothetical protein
MAVPYAARSQRNAVASDQLSKAISKARSAGLAGPAAAERPDEALRVRVLPRRSASDDDLLEPEMLAASLERLAVNSIAVPNRVASVRRPRQRFDHLLRRPSGRRMIGNTNVKHAPPGEAEDNEDEQPLAPDGRHDGEVDGDHLGEVVAKKRSPSLRGRAP